LDGASSAGLVGHWTMNAITSGTIEDSSGEGNTGTVSGATLDTANQKLGAGCLSFDGVNDYVDCGNDASLNLTDEITISFWAKYNNSGVIIGKSYMAYEINIGSTKFDGFIGTNLGIHWHWVGAVDILHGATITDWNRWTWVIKSGQYVKFYANGVYKGQYASSSIAIWLPTSVLYFGIRANGTLPFDGLLDDVRIYNRALSAAEITALYNSGTGTESAGAYTASSGTFISRALDTGGNTALGTIKWDSTISAECGDGMAGEISSSESGLVGLWHFNSETTGTVTDATANANTLTLGTATVDDSAEPTYTAYDAGDPKDLGTGYFTFDGTDYAVQKTYATEEGTVKVSTASGAGFVWDYGENIYTAGQDFSTYAGVGGSSTPYMIVIKDAENDVAWGYLGEEGGGSELSPDNTAISDNQTEINAVTGWSLYGSPTTFVSSSEDVNSGAYAFKVVGNGSATGFTRASFTGGALTAGKSYEIRYDIKVTAGTVGFQVRDGANTQNLTSNSNAADSAWHTIVKVLTAIDSDIRVYFWQSGETQATWYVDNFSLKLVEGLGSELAVNGNMELDSGWTDKNTPTINERSDVQAHGGVYSRHIVSDGTLEGIQQYISGTAGKLYYFECYVYLVSGDVELDADNELIGSSNVDSTATTGSWIKLSGYKTFRTNSSALFIRSSTVAASEFYVDDVSVQEVTTPSPTTGMTVYTTKAGLTKGMNLVTVDNGFDPNDTLTYEVRKSDFQITGR